VLYSKTPHAVRDDSWKKLDIRKDALAKPILEMSRCRKLSYGSKLGMPEEFWEFQNSGKLNFSLYLSSFYGKSLKSDCQRQKR
jgi:hypothetical protein